MLSVRPTMSSREPEFSDLRSRRVAPKSGAVAGAGGVGGAGSGAIGCGPDTGGGGSRRRGTEAELIGPGVADASIVTSKAGFADRENWVTA